MHSRLSLGTLKDLSVHNNFYFLRQLTKALQPLLQDTVISECFSQNRDELVIRFETHGDPFFIKASLDPSFPCLSIPPVFHRARKNSVDLFPLIIGRRVKGIRQFDNERSFAILLSDDYALLFKMHGNRSNILLFEKEVALELFRNNIAGDRSLVLSHLDRSIDWGHEAFTNAQQKLPALYFTFGKLVWQYLQEHHFDDHPIDKQWIMIQEVRKQLEHPDYLITEWEEKIHLSLLALGKIRKRDKDPIHVINEFYYVHTHEQVYLRERSAALSLLNNKLQRSEQYLKKTNLKLMEIEHDTNYKTWADMIMANLHRIKSGSDKIELLNFYTNEPVMVKLKRELTPQKNAEVYYRKAKNQNIELQRLRQAMDIKNKEIEKNKEDLEKVYASKDLKTLRAVLHETGVTREKEKTTGLLPFHEFEFQGFRIWVGRNAQSNDQLTLKYGYKEDLWLHAKDVTGSHVLIKYQAGKNYPKDVIERAAQLAAYNSKRKNETLCPVVVTPRKFVRKRKGDPAGAVVVDREEDVILVEPRLY